MKTSTTLILAAIVTSALALSVRAQTPDDANNNPPAAEQPAPPPDDSAILELLPTPPDAPPGEMVDGGGNGPDAAAPAQSAPPVVNVPPATLQSSTASTNPVADSAPLDFAPPTQASGTNSDELRLNFRNAPLEMVLNYLSDAAGFIIVLDTQVRGTVSVISSHPMTKDEAVDLLNSVLNKNGYAAIRDGRTLTIVSKESAKTRDIPVKVNGDPNSIPKNDEIVTQIIPIRFVEARQLASDLSTFVSPQATVVANEAGNSIVITDTQANIRHLAEIIKAIDSSAESETEIRVFRLKYANPTDVANLLAGVFPSSTSSGNNNQTPIRFGGFGGFGGGGGGRFGGGGGQGGGNTGTAASGSNDRIKKAQQVVAVADLRTSSVVVTAAKDLMSQIDGMIRELDVNSTRDQKVYVFHMDNGDPQQAVQVLQNMFQTGTSARSSTSSSSQNSALMQRQQNNSTTTSSSSSSSGFGGSTTGGGARGGSGTLF